MQEHHDLADNLLFRPGVFDATAPFRADSFDVLEPAGFVFDYVKDVFTEFLDKLLRVNRANPFHHSAAEIFFDSLASGRRGALEEFGPKLKAELPVPFPPAFGREPLAGTDGRERAKDCDRFALAFDLNLQYGESVFLVEEGDPLDQSGESLERFRRCGRAGGPMQCGASWHFPQGYA